MTSRLRELRIQAGLTQEDLARRSGMTMTGYRNIEIGESVPKLDSAQSIAAALSTTIEEIWPRPLAEQV